MLCSVLVHAMIERGLTGIHSIHGDYPEGQNESMYIHGNVHLGPLIEAIEKQININIYYWNLSVTDFSTYDIQFGLCSKLLN